MKNTKNDFKNSEYSSSREKAFRKKNCMVFRYNPRYPEGGQEKILEGMLYFSKTAKKTPTHYIFSFFMDVLFLTPTPFVLTFILDMPEKIDTMMKCI